MKIEQLEAMGWEVIIVWEYELKIFIRKDTFKEVKELIIKNTGDK